VTRQAKRRLGVLVSVTTAGTLAIGIGQAPELLAGIELFRVEEVEVEGARFLDRGQAVAWAAFPPGLSVWDDLGPAEARLEAHPLVLEARIRRKLPRTLVVHLREREPVALYPTPVLVPVDGEGRRLPIDPAAHRLDLPLLVRGPESRALDQQALRTLAGEVVRLGSLEPRLAASLSDLALDPWGDVELRLAAPPVVLRYRPPLTPARLREGLQVLADARERTPDRPLVSVDLRFADQVVVRHAPPNRR
jgi:cell division septal protein FtsQ